MSKLGEVLASDCVGMTNAEALDYVHRYESIVDGMADSGNVLAYLASIGKIKALRALDTDISDACIVTLETREGFNFANPATRALLDTLVPSMLSAEQADYIQGIGNKTIRPLKSTTLKEIISLRNPEQVVESYSNSATSEFERRTVLAELDVSGHVPATCNVALQVRHRYNGELGMWRHVTTIGGIGSEGVYERLIPAEFVRIGSEFRCVCEYTLSMSLTATVV